MKDIVSNDYTRVVDLCNYLCRCCEPERYEEEEDSTYYGYPIKPEPMFIGWSTSAVLRYTFCIYDEYTLFAISDPYDGKFSILVYRDLNRGFRLDETIGITLPEDLREHIIDVISCEWIED